jgi:UDP-N-acetyl-D-mannosaminuronate dehydrogenase
MRHLRETHARPAAQSSPGEWAKLIRKLAVQHGLTRIPIDIRQKIRQVGVLGAGTMGNGIAQAFAVAGYSVIMRDIKPEYVERGMATVAKSLERLAARGKLPADARAATLARIRPTTDINDLGQCDLVVEAVLEDYELKPASSASSMRSAARRPFSPPTPHPFR